MKSSEINEPNFREAVEAIDTGNYGQLSLLLEKHPYLTTTRLASTDSTDYFDQPYLLWFIANNPIRVPVVTYAIIAITDLLIQALKKENSSSWQDQVDYTLGLVATGRIVRESGVQIQLMDLLIDAGATPDTGINALANGNKGAAARLIKRGGKLTLAAAVCLEMENDRIELAREASITDKELALAAAAFYGQSNMVSWLLNLGANPNSYPQQTSGFHSHATPLHQAVSAGSLAAVKLLVEAGASLSAKDKVYAGTALDWAGFLLAAPNTDETTLKELSLIADYLRKMSRT